MRQSRLQVRTARGRKVRKEGSRNVTSEGPSREVSGRCVGEGVGVLRGTAREGAWEDNRGTGIPGSRDLPRRGSASMRAGDVDGGSGEPKAPQAEPSAGVPQ